MTGEEEGMSAPPCLEGRVPVGGVLLQEGAPQGHTLDPLPACDPLPVQSPAQPLLPWKAE